MDTATLQTISPIDHSVYVERPLAGASEIDSAVDQSRHAQFIWQQLDLEQRAAICRQPLGTVFITIRIRRCWLAVVLLILLPYRYWAMSS